MDKPVKCAWCGEVTVPKVSHSKNDYGGIIERRCSECGKVLAAYLEQEEDFLPDIRFGSSVGLGITITSALFPLPFIIFVNGLFNF